MFVHLKIMDPCEGMELQPVAHGSLYLLVCRREDDVTSCCIFFKIRTRDIICLSGCVCNGFKSCRRTLESLRRLKRECEMQTQIVLAANGIVKPRDEVAQNHPLGKLRFAEDSTAMPMILSSIHPCCCTDSCHSRCQALGILSSRKSQMLSLDKQAYKSSPGKVLQQNTPGLSSP